MTYEKVNVDGEDVIAIKQETRKIVTKEDLEKAKQDFLNQIEELDNMLNLLK